MLGKILGYVWRKMPRRLRLKTVSLSQAKFVVSVGGVVLNEKEEILLLSHVLRVSRKGWGIPGGFANHGEQPADTLRRELEEEIGLQIKDLKLISIRTMNRKHIEIIFRARTVGEPEISSFEIRDFKWFPRDALPAELSRGQAEIIRRSLEK